MRGCEFKRRCKEPARVKILTKVGDFWVCDRHAKEAERYNEVRYVVMAGK